ncbi:fluoride efflux transporter CrcB [Lentzea flaviverrucosa]|uniref:Fluoride-specific ion channel FluC n=1 Tax=Lentzea flaviverrucosa TaxID=200379 RepID=A0A1H9XL31_9PSEU|nr:fluoride efflux transporter CrcB [Lentzea flaviverrucosa]RDI20289.1 camphor resistance protein CrcB [Lentzea flaviverrucosa]SES46373.1 CrcB protein [Lentzea flaviverrucosa]
MTALVVFLGAALGAPTRYLLDRFVQSRHSSDFPWGTLTVNAVGCLLIGFVVGTSWMPLLGVGFCGGLTTYSTFSYETVKLLEAEKYRAALLNVVVSVVLGVGAASVGLALAH